jgi:Proteasome subunit
VATETLNTKGKQFCLLFYEQTEESKRKMGDSGFSYSLTTFSRTGKLLPIEYALNAVANGRTALGIAVSDGVVLATDKKLPSTLVDDANVHKIERITDTTGFCFAGVGPDYRVLGTWIHREPAPCVIFLLRGISIFCTFYLCCCLARRSSEH